MVLGVAVALANTLEYNAHTLKAYWYAMYQRAFKDFEEYGDRVVILCPQSTVSRVDCSYLPHRKDDPHEFFARRGRLGRSTTSILAPTPPANTRLPRKRTEEVRLRRMKGRMSGHSMYQWRIPDFAILASPCPTGTAATVGDSSPTDILAPSLPAGTVTTPEIIEIQRQKSNDITAVASALTTV